MSDTKLKIEELVKATLIMGCRRGGNHTHDSALALVEQSIPSITNRFMALAVYFTEAEINEIRNFVDGVLLHGSRNFIYLDNVKSLDKKLPEIAMVRAAKFTSLNTEGFYITDEWTRDQIQEFEKEPGNKVEIVEMSRAEYRAIPATQSAIREKRR